MTKIFFFLCVSKHAVALSSSAHSLYIFILYRRTRGLERSACHDGSFAHQVRSHRGSVLPEESAEGKERGAKEERTHRGWTSTLKLPTYKIVYYREQVIGIK